MGVGGQRGDFGGRWPVVEAPPEPAARHGFGRACARIGLRRASRVRAFGPVAGRGPVRGGRFGGRYIVGPARRTGRCKRTCVRSFFGEKTGANLKSGGQNRMRGAAIVVT